MTTLYLVRHGETVDNVRKIMQGQTQGELTPTGVEQAQQLCRQLLHEPIDSFVSSDLQRAIDTCAPLLRERDWGSFTGRYIPDLQHETWPDDIESLDDLCRRAQHFITWLKTAMPHQHVLAVGHGIINKAIQSVFFQKPMNQVQRMENAEVRILEL